MIFHTELSQPQLHNKIKRQLIQFAGNQKLKIYGRLSCASGKRMLVKNRVFFKDESEAIANHYRPCGHCMKQSYQQWKQQQ